MRGCLRFRRSRASGPRGGGRMHRAQGQAGPPDLPYRSSRRCGAATGLTSVTSALEYLEKAPGSPVRF